MSRKFRELRRKVDFNTELDEQVFLNPEDAKTT